MPVRSAVPHILSDFRLEQLIYRIFLLSPFEIVQDQQLATTWRIRLYMCIMLLGYTVLRISFCLQFQNNDAYEYLSANGNLWMFANVFYLTLSSLTFTVVILNGFITGNDQIEYFQELFDVDMKLFTSFGINLKRSRWRLASNGLLVLGFVNNIRYFVISMTSNHTTILTPFQMFSFNFTCYFDYILSLFTAVFYVNCTQLCRERLASTSKLLQNYSNLSTEQMDTVLQLFVQIRRLTLLINRFMGVVVLLKIPHDFINGSFVVYVMCSSLYSSKELVDSVEILLWFVEAVIGPIVMTLTAEMLSREANECAEILSSLRTDDISVSKQNRLDQILLWIRHQAPTLNACGYFPIDLRLLFAISCGVITYMIVLLQLQNYDEQSMKTLDFA